MSNPSQERFQVYPPTHLHRSIPLSLKQAQARIANYLALADIRENTHLHPDAQLTSAEINRSSQGGSAGGLILSHLRRVQKGLNGERIESDAKLLEDDWDKDTREHQSGDTRLDASIAQGGYASEKKSGGDSAEGKTSKRKQDEMDTQTDSVTLLNSSERQTQAQADVHSKGLGQPDDTEGWQTMDSYQREIEEEEDEEGDIGRRHNFRQQTEPEQQVQDTEMHAKPGAEKDVDKEVGKDLKAGKEKAKKKRKRKDDEAENEESVERQDWAAKATGEEGRKAKKAKKDSTEWSFKGLRENSHVQDKRNTTSEPTPSTTTSTKGKTAKKGKEEKISRKPGSQPPNSSTVAAGLSENPHVQDERNGMTKPASSTTTSIEGETTKKEKKEKISKKDESQPPNSSNVATGLSKDSHVQDEKNGTSQPNPPTTTSTEGKTAKKEKKKKPSKKSESQPPSLSTTAAGLSGEKDSDSARMPPPPPPPKNQKPAKSQTNGTTASTKSKDTKASTTETKGKSHRNDKPAGVPPNKLTDRLLQSVQRKSPIPPRPSPSPSPAPEPKNDTKSSPARPTDASPEINGTSVATPLLDTSQKKGKKEKSKGDGIGDEAYAEAQTNGASHPSSSATSVVKAESERESDSQRVLEKAPLDKEARRKAKRQRDKEYRREQNRVKTESQD